MRYILYIDSVIDIGFDVLKVTMTDLFRTSIDVKNFTRCYCYSIGVELSFIAVCC